MFPAMANKITFSENDFDQDANESGSDDEYTQREQYLIKKYKDGKKKSAKDSDDEVLRFGDDDDEEEDSDENAPFENDSDIVSDNDDDIPDAKAWGKSKSSFYNTNYVDQDYGTLTVQDEESALLEEEEARTIQQRLTKTLNEADFSIDAFITKPKEEKPTKDSAGDIKLKLKSDLTGLSAKQKQMLLRKDAPEFDGLVDELNMKMEEIYNELEPIMEQLKTKAGVPVTHPIYQFVQMKNQLQSTYCMNISFYLLLKASQKPIKNHPVLKRLVQMQKLLAQLDEKYESGIRPEIERLLEDIANEKTITFPENVKSAAPQKKPKKRLNMLKTIEKESGLFNDENDSEADNDDDEEGRMIEAKLKKQLEQMTTSEAMDEDENNDDNEDEDMMVEGVEAEKRRITYQMAKNKGLTPHRKKEQRNPRVKHRNKFRKAIIRRKGAVRTVRTETTRYSGEHSGIKATVRKGIKIK